MLYFVWQHISFVLRNYPFVLKVITLNFWMAFAFKITPFGTYINIASSNNSSIQEIGTFYFVQTSDFSSTLFGRFLLAFTQPFVGQFLTLVLGITLNIVSVYRFKSYFEQGDRRDKNEVKADKPSERETINCQIEKNLFYMALTLSSISILSRCLIILSSFFFQFFTNISNIIYIYYLYNYYRYFTSRCRCRCVIIFECFRCCYINCS